MAFPTSPTDEDFYNGYLYDSTKESWTTKDGPWHEVGDSGEPAFQNGWGAHTSQVKLKFRKTSDGCVEIVGGATTGSSVIFTLPAGYRPGAAVYFPVTCYRTADSEHVMEEGAVSSAGAVSISETTGYSDTKIWIRFAIGIT